MQGLIEVADNFTPSRRDRDAVVASQCNHNFSLFFLLMLAPKQLFNAHIG